MNYLGVDIGGTKCAVSVGTEEGHILEKVKFPTETEKGVEYTLRRITEETQRLFSRYPDAAAIGISCGGPLDSRKGLILSPPNLPGWDGVPIVEIMRKHFRIPAYLQNDADACAVAEWKFGAGKGYENLVFLTFGTGFGAGLILNGKLYTGGCNMAGEIGHIRLTETGPVGYGKAGSLEGYCSGGGILQYGYGTAEEIGRKAADGDEKAIGIYQEVGRNLGRGAAILADLLNPDAIIIGSIFVRQRKLIEPELLRVLGEEALPQNAAHVKILPAALGEQLGDIAAVSVGIEGYGSR